ncbi:MAG: nicotinate phosphoribosyltransferase [Candidatus Omnitrophota bacterium]
MQVNQSLAVDLYELTMAQVYYKQKRNTVATFDALIRSEARPFYVACGIDDALLALENFRFNPEDVEYLKGLRIFDDDFLNYLATFKFNGTVYSVEEPEILFASEPLLRVTANIIEGQIVESIVLNRLNLAITLATKALRITLAAKGRKIYDFSLRRTQGIEAALACARYSYICGIAGTSNLQAGFLYNIPVAGTMAHSFVMSFEREIESFAAFAKTFPARSILLVDTYNTKKGIDNAIKIAAILRKMGCGLVGIRLDSGTLQTDAKYARILLDKKGLIDTIIFASGNLDEYKIGELIKQKAPIDAFGVGTNMGCSSDLPFTDVIYKLVEVKESGNDFIPTMKLSENKTTLPGKKQIFRSADETGIIRDDTIALEGEKLSGKKLLKKVMDKGRRLHKNRSLPEKKKILLEKIKKLPDEFKQIKVTAGFPVNVSKQLSALTERLKEQIEKRTAEKVVFLDIDTQNDFIHEGGVLYVKGSEKIIDNIKTITAFTKTNDILIISSQDTHKKNCEEFKQFEEHCLRGTRGHKKIKESLKDNYKLISCKKVYSVKELKKFISSSGQLILEKNNLNLFSNPNALPLLNLIFPDKIYLYGVVTEYCVKEAITELLKHDFPLYVIEDAVKEISSAERDRLFSVWKQRGVQFIKTQAVLAKIKP